MNINLIKFLFALCLLFVFILFLEWEFSGTSGKQFVEVLPTENDTQNQEVELPEITLSKQAKETFVTIVDKPLFIQGRKPVDEATGIDDRYVGGRVDDLILDGIYTVDKQMIALMREGRGSGEYLKKSEGDDIIGWTIKEIWADRVVLVLASDKKSILLRKPRDIPKLRPKKAAKRKSDVSKKRNLNLEKEHD